MTDLAAAITQTAGGRTHRYRILGTVWIAATPWREVEGRCVTCGQQFSQLIGAEQTPRYLTRTCLAHRRRSGRNGQRARMVRLAQKLINAGWRVEPPPPPTETPT